MTQTEREHLENVKESYRKLINYYGPEVSKAALGIVALEEAVKEEAGK